MSAMTWQTDRQTYQPTSWVSFRHAWRGNFMLFQPPLQDPPSFNVPHWFFVRDGVERGSVQRRTTYHTLLLHITIRKSNSVHHHSVRYSMADLLWWSDKNFAMIWWGVRVAQSLRWPRYALDEWQIWNRLSCSEWNGNILVLFSGRSTNNKQVYRPVFIHQS